MELTCAVQNYHWGKQGNSSLVGKLAFANSKVTVVENKTYAEFWMGTHPNGPSYLKNEKIELSNYLTQHPNELGLKITKEFGSQLPFLLKVLSVEQPLSIQAHPTKSHAEQLFKNYPNIYKDSNHKPELAVALTKFEALCGFRPLSQIKNFFKNVPEFNLLIDPCKIECFLKCSEDNSVENSKLFKECFQCMMLCEGESVTLAVDKLITRLEKNSSLGKEECLDSLIRKIHSSFPNDVGIFCVYWLNYLVLSPGEALYLAPNEPHAYLYGDCLECMANSDNVVRAGLTPKFRDVPTLNEMLTYKNYTPSEILFQPIKEDEYSVVYSPPVKDFAVAKITLPNNKNYMLKQRDSASILLVIEGSGEMNCNKLEFGKVFFLPYGTECKIKSDDGLVLFQAFCNV